MDLYILMKNVYLSTLELTVKAFKLHCKKVGASESFRVSSLLHSAITFVSPPLSFHMFDKLNEKNALFER